MGWLYHIVYDDGAVSGRWLDDDAVCAEVADGVTANIWRTEDGTGGESVVTIMVDGKRIDQ